MTVFDKLYGDLSPEQLYKLTPMQIQDRTSERNQRRRDVLLDLDKATSDVKARMREGAVNAIDQWRKIAQGTAMINESGYVHGFSDSMWRKAALAAEDDKKVLAFLEDQRREIFGEV